MLNDNSNQQVHVDRLWFISQNTETQKPLSTEVLKYSAGAWFGHSPT